MAARKENTTNSQRVVSLQKAGSSATSETSLQLVSLAKAKTLKRLVYLVISQDKLRACFTSDTLFVLKIFHIFKNTNPKFNSKSSPRETCM